MGKKLEREKETLGNKLEDKERALEKKTTELRTAKEAAAASNIRARKAQVLSSRARPSPSKPKASAAAAADKGGAKAPAAAPAPAAPATPPEEVARIRGEVLKLLEEHDKSKVNRINVIMEKFKGKEELLLEKMKQRYVGNPDDAGKSRSEIAAERHRERMKQMRAKK